MNHTAICSQPGFDDSQFNIASTSTCFHSIRIMRRSHQGVLYQVHYVHYVASAQPYQITYRDVAPPASPSPESHNSLLVHTTVLERTGQILAWWHPRIWLHLTAIQYNQAKKWKLNKSQENSSCRSCLLRHMKNLYWTEFAGQQKLFLWETVKNWILTLLVSTKQALSLTFTVLFR